MRRNIAFSLSDTLRNTDFAELFFSKLLIALISWLNKPNKTAQISDSSIFTELLTVNSLLQIENGQTFSELFDIPNDFEEQI